MVRRRDLLRAVRVVSGWCLILWGMLLILPVGTRITGPACPAEVCHPVGLVQQTGIFGHPINWVTVVAAGLAALGGVALYTGHIGARYRQTGEG